MIFIRGKRDPYVIPVQFISPFFRKRGFLFQRRNIITCIETCQGIYVNWNNYTRSEINVMRDSRLGYLLLYTNSI